MDDWNGIENIDIYDISKNGLKLLEEKIEIENIEIQLSLEPNQAVLIVPSGKKIQEA